MSEEHPLAEQLAAAREAFRQERDRERADLEKRRADIDQRAERLKAMRAEVRVEREKVRKTYRRYLKRMKAKWSAERMSVASARAAIDRDRADLTRQQDQFHADRNRQTEQLSEYKRRLYQAWELLAENQRRLLADRQQAEGWIAHQTATADRRVRESLEREQRLNDALSGLEGRRAAAAAEIVGLETRAANLRAVVQRLEGQRAKGVGRPNEAELVAALEPPPVQFGVPHDADRLLSDLQESAQAANRERAKVAAERDHLRRQADDLDDQRTVLAEQVATLAVARQEWQATEHRLLTEMEELARQVRLRELAADDRERAIGEADSHRQEQDRQSSELRRRLERWQAALAAYEATAGADRERAENELNARQAELQRRAASLESIRGVWIAMRDQERVALEVELKAAADDRERLAHLCELADRARLAYLDEAAKVATVQLAEAEGAKDARRLRVLTKRWESRFEQYRKDLVKRLEAAKAECDRADARIRELHAAVIEATTRHAAATDAQAAIDRVRLTEEVNAVPAVIVDESETEKYLHTLRGEIERLSTLLDTAPSEPDVIPLRLSAAA
ncbi:MAG: hypothetical protein MUF18_09395 [Fimbriiglobus sp.]|nr:hypothetical protein [Fimbriiglobus sp.]